MGTGRACQCSARERVRCGEEPGRCFRCGGSIKPGRQPQVPGFHMNRDEFVFADARRLGSVECDAGFGWQSGDVNWPRWHVSWLVSTGEVIAVETVAGGNGRVVVLGVVPTVEAFHEALAGWEHWVGQPNGLEWARTQIAEWMRDHPEATA